MFERVFVAKFVQFAGRDAGDDKWRDVVNHFRAQLSRFPHCLETIGAVNGDTGIVSRAYYLIVGFIHRLSSFPGRVAVPRLSSRHRKG